jgi:hypothetical protein
MLEVTVTAADADLPMSATEVAVTVTVRGLGAMAGAEYVTGAPLAELVAESVPHGVPEQPAPVTDQVTPELLGSLKTVAVNC